MPRPNFPTENLEHGTKWTDPLGVQWVWRVAGIAEDQESLVGAWHQVMSENSKLFRKTTVIESLPDNNQVIYAADSVDETIFFPYHNGSISTVNVVFPTVRFDGQLLIMSFATAITNVNLRYYGYNGGVTNILTAVGGSTYCYQFVEQDSYWRPI